MPTRDDAVEIPTEGGPIAGTFVTPRRRVPGVLFVHGWGGSQEQYLARARTVAALGCVCLTFDLTGHAATGEQQKTVSREQNLRDVLAAYDVLAAHRNVDPAHIAVVGSSYGGYLAAILSSVRAVRWLALRAPALYIDSGWEIPKARLHKEQGLAAWRRNFIAVPGNRALEDCAAFDGDVLVVESEYDEVIPNTVIASYLEAFGQARSLTYRVLSGADHGLTDEGCQRAYSALLVNWMTEMAFAPSDTVVPQPPTRTERPAEMPEAPPGQG